MVMFCASPGSSLSTKQEARPPSAVTPDRGCNGTETPMSSGTLIVMEMLVRGTGPVFVKVTRTRSSHAVPATSVSTA
ncbi:hypothetical protein DSECCO2_515500 [anaerobic digester metagenome]